ncbi:uncharacterized protein [Hemitrygon akajei]|uniref:uncharacterized protein n=1 Tax=Hemitrygon akajei TaxID=2704970 RepID=UPI003BF97DE8
MRNLRPLAFCFLGYYISLPALCDRPLRFSDKMVPLRRVPGCRQEAGGPGVDADGDIANLLSRLESELESQPELSAAWSQAGLELGDSTGGSGPSISEELAQTVMAYTLEYPPPPATPFYLIFNRETRLCLASSLETQTTPTSCVAFRTYRSLLSRALKELRGREDVDHPGTVYRGASLPFRAKQGQTIEFGAFTSASASREVAEAFTGGGGTMFHIRTARGAPVDSLSPFPGEREVLIPPCESFQVDKVHHSKGPWGGEGRVEIFLTSVELLGGNSGGREGGSPAVPVLVGLAVLLVSGIPWS